MKNHDRLRPEEMWHTQTYYLKKYRPDCFVRIFNNNFPSNGKSRKIIAGLNCYYYITSLLLKISPMIDIALFCGLWFSLSHLLNLIINLSSCPRYWHQVFEIWTWRIWLFMMSAFLFENSLWPCDGKSGRSGCLFRLRWRRR